MKRTVEIKRTFSSDKQTLGELRVYEPDGGVFATFKTLELPWLDNKRKVSCIPTGFYKLAKVMSSGKIPYPHLWIYPVTERDGIKIHRGNYSRQIEGCVLVGLEHIDIDKDGLTDVSNSTTALDWLMAALPDETTMKIT